MAGPAPPAERPERRLTTRRLLGLDRSVEPPETRRGQPLRPVTLPNLVGYLRLAAIPVFLAIALGSGDGRAPAAAAVFLAIALSDYLDGLLARVTGQYSRMGALLDPIVDRLLILAGAAVCWRFELLPRWALALLAARELVTLVLAQIALRRGLELTINWLGRLAVWPIMGAIFLAMAIDSALVDAMLILGVIAAWAATLAYARAGASRLRGATTGAGTKPSTFT